MKRVYGPSITAGYGRDATGVGMIGLALGYTAGSLVFGLSLGAAAQLMKARIPY